MRDRFISFWRRITSRDKPESGNATFDSDGNVVNIDRHSQSGEHGRIIVDYSKKVIKEVKDTATTIKNKVDETAASIANGTTSIIEEAKTYTEKVTDPNKKDESVVTFDQEAKAQQKEDEKVVEKVIEITQPIVQNVVAPAIESTKTAFDSIKEKITGIFK